MMLPISNKKLYFIVVGTGRCGTVYLTQLLNSIGIPCSHEKLFSPKGLEHTDKVIQDGGRNSEVAKHSGINDKKYVAAEASYMAVPYLDCSVLADSTIIHLVRNPIDVILSFHNKLQYWHKKELNIWEQFILSNLPEIRQYKTPLMKNCCFVVRWNQWIESKSKDRNYIRIRLEHDIDKLLTYLKTPIYPNLKKMNTHESWKQKQKPLDNEIDMKTILESGFGSQVKLLLERYEYDITN